MAALATRLVGNHLSGRLLLIDPLIDPDTAKAQWQKLMPALDAGIRERMALDIRESAATGTAPGTTTLRTRPAVHLDRPNYRYEVIRVLLAAGLGDTRPPTIREMQEFIGVSQTPIRQTVSDLKDAGLIRVSRNGLSIAPETVSQETLARVRALPQTLRFRFERGAGIKPPATLADRATQLARADATSSWRHAAISGVAAAQRDLPQINVVGLPRLDLIVNVGRHQTTLDSSFLRLLDDGLEPEPNVLAPAPVVLTLARADIGRIRLRGEHQVRYAATCDSFLALLDAGLRDVALQYASRMKR